MASQVTEIDGHRRERSMSIEDAEMFQNPHPYNDDSSASSSPKSAPLASPSKREFPEQLVLRPIGMPEPFKI
eukprot:CAMPEP_0196141666 /NCGR_PEP_ID=MMETSP0910-20130528/10163_1 /TAXON_ID=49265 /ORGANISM="Thalassiosira rotula, Strain GSO102" /LENGTH=71 /DNA_ID=CAMNT_0041402849 /DNA_START=112 /DNA_END=327 /DNA_ORIENTATION=-